MAPALLQLEMISQPSQIGHLYSGRASLSTCINPIYALLILQMDSLWAVATDSFTLHGSKLLVQLQDALK